MTNDADETLRTIHLADLVQVNETQKSTQNGQRVIVLEDGRLLFSFNNGGLVWQSGVNARAANVTDDGSLVFDQEFRVSEPADFAPHNPEVLQLPDGRLLYSYIGFYNDGSGTSVIGRVANLSEEGSVTFGDEFLINEHGYHNQYFQRMIKLDDGRVLFAFETFSGVDGDDSFGGISARIGTVTSENEVSFGEEFRVNEATELRQEDVQIVQLTDGRILFVYTSTISNPQHIVGRVGTLNPDGSMTFGDEVSLEDVGPQGQPKLTLLSDGQVLFSYALTGSQTYSAITRFLTVGDDGSISLGEKTVLNEHFYGLTSGLEIDTLPDGRILFVFRTSDPETNVENNPHYDSKGGLVGQFVLPGENGGLEVGVAFRLDPYWAGHQWDVQVTPISNEQLLLSFSTHQMTEEGSFTEDILTHIVKLNGLGTSSDDTLIAASPGTLEGLDGDDILVGSPGADTFNGGAGNDLITGGGGHDTVDYLVHRQSVSLDLIDDGSVSVVESDGSVDTLNEIERINFLDGDLLFDMDSPNLGFTYRIYSAGFGRTPDEGGLRFWTEVMDQFDIVQPDVDKQLFLAKQFLTADEYVDLYGANPSNEQYVGDLYVNVLGRLPDQDGYDFWVWVMEQGYSREEILVYFAESVENTEKTAPDLDDGVWVT